MPSMYGNSHSSNVDRDEFAPCRRRRFLGQTSAALAGVAGLQLPAAAQQQTPIVSALKTKGKDQGCPTSSPGSRSINMPRVLIGKVAVVTGAARGIGRAAAIALARSGAQVAGIDICAMVDPHSGVTPATRADLDQTGRLVEAAGTHWQGFVLDQRDLTALRNAVPEIAERFGGIDILFANAGIDPGIQPSAGNGRS